MMNIYLVLQKKISKTKYKYIQNLNLSCIWNRTQFDQAISYSVIKKSSYF
jgi:hypothetical protein